MGGGLVGSSSKWGGGLIGGQWPGGGDMVVGQLTMPLIIVGSDWRWSWLGGGATGGWATGPTPYWGWRTIRGGASQGKGLREVGPTMNTAMSIQVHSSFCSRITVLRRSINTCESIEQ